MKGDRGRVMVPYFRPSGGGTSLWAAPEWKADPREIFNRRLIVLTAAAAFAGSSYGFDVGIISGVLKLPAFVRAFGMDVLSKAERDKRAGNIAAMVAAGASGGALLGAPMSDYLGRKRAVLVASFVFLLGCSLQEVAHLGVFYAGRLLGGLAIGATSMLGPQYLAEVAPKSIRGSLTAAYTLMVVTSLALAFGSTTAPRALVARGRRQQGIQTLAKLHRLPEDHAYVAGEAMETCAQAATNASNRRRFFMAVTLFLFHKLTGTDSLTYFAPDIFAMIGAPAGSSSLLTTGVYGLVKMVMTVVYLTVIVDRVGRRLPLMIGATMQATAMLYLALYVRFGTTTAQHQAGGTPAGGIVGIICIYLYAVGWSFGHSVAPYVIAAEIFPPRIRSVCIGVCLFVNWIVNYGITLATPTMMTCLGYGTFLLYSMLTYAGVFFIYFCLPELKGRSIESMDDLFQRSIWTMWRHAYPTQEEKVRHDVRDRLVRQEKTAAAKSGSR
ncbi:H(+)/hexose cotransporter 1 [Magnaporthiopsis poae ATCC 64411]|uniref:H(+)/hexose cotransporter 1 n=1 Tax=Magnaporthiopsis poae (strain ATCC 64411 / 73-15) TaxID=644358 RepID=A0A0C4EB26_MAGP6|nr:H(+)/hexose cotransporter 1 [Magnaporthiopsis poae ATCC 64411]